jgi:hypothetical protein
VIGALVTGAMSGVVISLVANQGLKSSKGHRLIWIFVVTAVQVAVLFSAAFVRDNLLHVPRSERSSFTFAFAMGLLVSTIPLFVKWGRRQT